MASSLGESDKSSIVVPPIPICHNTSSRSPTRIARTKSSPVCSNKSPRGSPPTDETISILKDIIEEVASLAFLHTKSGKRAKKKDQTFFIITSILNLLVASTLYGEQIFNSNVVPKYILGLIPLIATVLSYFYKKLGYSKLSERHLMKVPRYISIEKKSRLMLSKKVSGDDFIKFTNTIIDEVVGLEDGINPPDDIIDKYKDRKIPSYLGGQKETVCIYYGTQKMHLNARQRIPELFITPPTTITDPNHLDLPMKTIEWTPPRQYIDGAESMRPRSVNDMMLKRRRQIDCVISAIPKYDDVRDRNRFNHKRQESVISEGDIIIDVNKH